MAGEKQFSLFGMPTPEEVRQQIGKTNLAEDLAMAQMPHGTMGKALMGGAGRLLSQGVGNAVGYVDPRIQRAERMKMAQQRVQQIAQEKGINFGTHPKEYLGTAAQVFAEMGEQDLALQVMDKVNAMMVDESEVYKNQAAGDADYANAQTKANEAYYKWQDIQSKIDTRTKQLVIDRMKADAYRQATAAQANGSGVKMQQWQMYKPLLDKMQSGIDLSPGEQSVFNQLGKVFSFDQTLGMMFSGQMGGVPEPTGTVPNDSMTGTGGNDGVVDIDDY